MLLPFVRLLPNVKRRRKLVSERCRPAGGNTRLQKTRRRPAASS